MRRDAGAKQAVQETAGKGPAGNYRVALAREGRLKSSRVEGNTSAPASGTVTLDCLPLSRLLLRSLKHGELPVRWNHVRPDGLERPAGTVSFVSQPVVAGNECLSDST